ncbi:hypothetical protein ACWDA3_26075 [Nonomuraea rubra]
MTRQRLRPAHTPAQLAHLYRQPHDHTRWADHRLRVAVTVELAAWTAQEHRVRVTADLSCGDGTILRSVPAAQRYFGDIAPGYEFHGPIEQTIDEIPHVDLYICAETLEHLDDPDDVLARIRSKAGRMVLSTPIDAWGDNNPEHYWAWSRSDVEEMLAAAGWEIDVYTELDVRPKGLMYAYGIWGVR